MTDPRSDGSSPRKSAAVNFFLNEGHELTRTDAPGGGRQVDYLGVDWAVKGLHLQGALAEVRSTLLSSVDPLRERRFFLLVQPTAKVVKASQAKSAQDGTKSEPTNFAGPHSRTFHKLGMDLISTSADGQAVVHATRERVDQMIAATGSLGWAGRAEQSRWVRVEDFSAIPRSLRLDDEWVATLPPEHNVETMIELQPLLTRVESEEVMRAIVALLHRSVAERLVATGTDFSGRPWFRGFLSLDTLMRVATDFFSVQSLHPPLMSEIVVARSRARRVQQPQPAQAESNPEQMPVVAVVDTGVPLEHPVLKPYRRGTYQHVTSAGLLGDHGSRVASRIVFGDFDYDPDSQPRPSCRYLDVVVSRDAGHVDDKIVVNSLDAVAGAFPDVRVFNLSFGSRVPLGEGSRMDRLERMAQVRELDNFIFARDVIVVVAAGNSPEGVRPSLEYPLHVDDPAWALNHWPAGFNTIACGSSVERLSPHALVTEMGWPSPFTRIGPGLAKAPVPEYSAHGGNTTRDYTFEPGLGVWTCSPDGMWEDCCGTSMAAPLVAREAAFALQALQRFCPPGSRPYAATVKAWFALTSALRPMPRPVAPLAERTLGRGAPQAHRLREPEASTATFVWQGVLDSPGDVARVQLPIPQSWLRQAQQPVVRIVVAWDTPAHDAVMDTWGCRRVILHLKPHPDAPALRGRGKSHPSYPLIDRRYHLGKEDLTRKQVTPSGDMWLVELHYEQIAEYFPAIEFSPQQRVAFTAELVDDGEHPVSPQEAIQALAVAPSLVRLSAPVVSVAPPILIRSRL